ncbi:beta strand repeat-containing protein [Panacagrimonas perspica]|nr:carboxypeptidase-like regulatory domain-containing protein [Panacagrimonas perspica]
MAATFGMGLSGCNDDNNSSNNGPGLGGQNSPKGTVIGTVLDTNGNPIANATVTIGTRSQTTNAAGAYQFDNLAVTDAVLQTGSGGSSGSGSANNPALPITVQAPPGFLGGNTKVKLNSQYSCSEVTDGGGQTNPQCVLIDGFNVGAGSIILPATTGTLTGVLRDQINGQVIGNQVLTLDFAGLKLDQNNAGAEGFQASGTILTTTTAADGTFTFANVAVDSCYDLRAANLDLNFANNDPDGSSAGAGCTTIQPSVDANEIRFSINEGANTALLVQASAISTEDLTKPFVTRVAGVVDGSTPALVSGAGQLQAGVNSVFTIDFSEALVAGLAAGQNDVVVTVGTGVNTEFRPSTVTIVDANTITVTLATPIPDGTVFNIDLLRDTFRDTNGNSLGLNDQNSAPTTGGNTGSNNPGSGGPGGGPAATQPPVAYDLNAPNGYVRLLLRTFNPLDIDTGAATVSQDLTAENPSTDSFFAATQALADFIPGSGTLNFANKSSGNTTQNVPVSVDGMQQLNAVFPLNPSQAHPLKALADILDDRVLGGSTGPAIDVAAAAADITFGTADHYLAWVEDRNGTTLDTIQMSVQPVSPDAAGNPRIVGTLEGFQPGTVVPKSFSSAVTQFPGCNNPTAGFGNDACPIFVITKGNATGAKIYITDSSSTATTPFKPLRPGAVLKVIARTASGFTGSEISVPLVDAVAPTAGAQFFAGTAGALSSANAQNSGSGGTTINLTTSTGQVVYPITPQALELVEDAGPGATGLSGDTLREIQAASAAVLTGSAIDPGAASGNFIADAAGTTAFLAAANRGLGLVVTEPSAVVSGAVPVLSAGTTSAITGISSINGGVDELNQPVNLLGFLSNVLTLETDGRANNRTIDFSPTFTDTAAAPNQASRAIVNVRDFLPPIMTKALFDGRQFVFRFHEAVRGNGVVGFGGPTQDIVIDCGGTDIVIDIDATPTGAVSFGDGNRRVIVPLAINGAPNTGAIQSLPAAGIVNACFGGPASLNYAEGDQYTFATLSAAGDTTLPTVAVAPSHGAVTYPGVRDLANNTDLGVAQGNSWAFWAAQGLGMGRSGEEPAVGVIDGDETTPLFAIANILPPFVPQAIARGNNFTSAGGGNGLATQNINVTVTTSTPFYLTDGVAAAGPAVVAAGVGPDADTDNNNVLTQAELNAWAAAKFELAQVNPALSVPPTSVQILDSAGQDVTTTSGNNQQAQTIILTFVLGQDVEAGDSVRLIAGQGLGSQFDPTNTNIVIRPFDEGQPTPANGTNDRNELAPIPPLPQVYTCPQVGVVGTTGEC